MVRRWMWLGLLALVLGCAGSASAGVVAHWKLDDAAGTTATDSSGHGFNGTLLGGPTWTVGTDGGALELDGGDDYVDFGNPPSWPAGKAPRSMCGWGRTDSIASGYRWIAAYGSPGTGQAMFIGLNAGTLVAGGYNGDDIMVPGLWQVGEWFHAGLTYDGTTAKAYFNGREVGSLPKNWNLVLSRAHLGRQVNDAAEFWDGAVDDVRLYDRVLTAGQIKEVYAGGAPSFNKATDPSPADGALAVVMPLFQWGAGDNALFHNVYVGTSPALTEANLVGNRQMFTMLYYAQGLQPGATYYWRVDEIEKDGTTVHTGDVWTFVAQALTAYYPTPADGAVDASPTGALTWLPGQAVTKHHLYFGDSNDAVSKGEAGTDKGELTDPTFTPGALESLTTYYWRVDETVAGGAVKTGPVWRFTTCLPVDDFESYTDDLGSAIFDTWIDGFTNGLSGSTVGYAQAPFAEQTIVHGGKQSMPLDYDNVKSPFYSETEREFSSTQDWTAGSVTTLILWVRGRAGNAPAQLYFAVEDASKKVGIVAYPDKAVVGVAQWTQWEVPLSSFTDVNLAEVKKLYVGLGDRTAPVAGGSGRIFIDDIQLTKP